MQQTEKVRIRYATAKDAETIAALSHQTFYDTFAEHNTRENMDLFLERQFSKETLKQQVNEGKGIFLLAFLQTAEPAGYARLLENDNKLIAGNPQGLEIGRLYATKQSIGSGVGSALMQRSIDLAKEMGKKVIWLGVWEHNQRAIAFYQKWNFVKFGEQVFLLGKDEQTDWLMKKEL